MIQIQKNMCAAALNDEYIMLLHVQFCDYDKNLAALLLIFVATNLHTHYVFLVPLFVMLQARSKVSDDSSVVLCKKNIK